MVEQLVPRPEYQHLSSSTALLMGCPGAQAVHCGLLVLVAVHCADLPGLRPGGIDLIFVFNVWFVRVAEMFKSWMLLGFAGNLSLFC